MRIINQENFYHLIYNIIHEQNAAGVFKYLRNQVRTFKRKFARIKGFNTIIGNKLSKSGLFEETASYLLLALGRSKH